jgi:hypothetical protein
MTILSDGWGEREGAGEGNLQYAWGLTSDMGYFGR